MPQDHNKIYELAKSKLRDDDIVVVGIASSAGGLEALGPLVGNLSSSAPMAYVIVQHLAPQHRSMLAELLSRETALKVEEIHDRTTVRPGVVYITPPNNDVVYENGRLCLHPPGNAVGPKPSADRLFQSLAKAAGSRAIGVVLSGTGSDGTTGALAIKEAGGFVLVQNPDTARYNGMPNSAIEASAADAILDAAEIGRKLTEFALAPDRDAVFPVANDYGEELREIITLVEQRTGVDFSGYKTSTLSRRLSRRIAATGASDIAGYIRLLQEEPAEAHRFVQDALISVTSFFRDREVFEALPPIIDRLIEPKVDRQPIRLWVPGCATGEEAYSIAFLAMERIRQRERRHRVQMFATDLDNVALEKARRGIYPEAAVDRIPRDMLDRYFMRQGDGFAVRKEVRDCIVFARHDVTQDTPFVRIDLVSCRNLLIYLDADLQRTVLRAFHFSLVPDGVLLLGKSESAGQHPSLFLPLLNEARIFRRNPAAQVGPENPFLLRQPALQLSRRRAAPNRGIRDALAEHLKPRALLIDPTGEIRETEGNVDDFISIPPGKVQLNATKVLKPELRGEFWALLARAKKQKATVSGTPKVVDGAQQHNVRLTLAPAGPSGEPDQAFLLVIEDVMQPVPVPTPEEGQHVSQLQQELAATREHLQSVIEELEVSNEELQALNEELQASNEELHATSEEMETANEELQAANEELTTLNDELRARTNELQALNEDLENIQRSIGYSLLILDRKLRIKRFSTEVVRYFGITAADIGEPIIGIPTHIQIEGLFDRLSETIEKGKSHAIDISAEKASLSVRIRPFLNVNNEVDGAIIVVLDETLYREAQRRLTASEERFALAVQGSLEGIWDQPNLAVDDGYWSPRLVDMLGLREGERTSLKALAERVHPDDATAFNSALQAHLKTRHPFDIECRLKLDSGEIANIDGKRNGMSSGYGWFHIRGQATWDKSGQPVRMAGSVSDIGARKAAETRIRSLNEQLLRAEQLAHVGYWWLDISDGRVVWSDEIHRIYGTPPGFMPTLQSLLSFTHKDDRQAVEQCILSCCRSGESFHFEARIVRPDGEIRDVEAIGECERDSEGNISKIFGVLCDITERKRTERNLRGTTKTLERLVEERTIELQERVRERDLLLHELQHRVKNNLQMITGLVSMKKKHVAPDAQRVLLDVMQRINAIGFVYDIMLRRHEIERTDLVEVLAGLCAALEKAHAGKIGITFSADGASCKIPAEQAVNLAVVANELIANALKYAFPDGRQGHIAVRIGKISREWRLIIEDDGIGFTEEPTAGSGGFGLLIARSILRNMDGRVERVQQSGTRFDVVFPAPETP